MKILAKVLGFSPLVLAVEEWTQAISDFADANSETPLIFGYGFLATTFGPTGPTRQLIDSVVYASE